MVNLKTTWVGDICDLVDEVLTCSRARRLMFGDCFGTFGLRTRHSGNTQPPVFRQIHSPHIYNVGPLLNF
jgi:hypothetical protein